MPSPCAAQPAGEDRRLTKEGYGMKAFVLGLGLLLVTGARLHADEAEDRAVERVEEIGG